jgi:hypothetical protein
VVDVEMLPVFDLATSWQLGMGYLATMEAFLRTGNPEDIWKF